MTIPLRATVTTAQTMPVTRRHKKTRVLMTIMDVCGLILHKTGHFGQTTTFKVIANPTEAGVEAEEETVIHAMLTIRQFLLSRRRMLIEITAQMMRMGVNGQEFRYPKEALDRMARTGITVLEDGVMCFSVTI